MAGTITQMVVQKHDRERVSIFLDGEYAFSMEIMAAAHLRVGQFLADADIAALQAQDEQLRAYLAAVRLLGIRPRSRAEIERALQRKQVPEAAISWAIERLLREGYLDDAEFARFWSENRTQFRPRSSRALRFELRQKGVASADMENALEAVDDDAAAWDAALARWPRLQNLEPQEAREKLLSFLARRGFSFETARRVWKRLEAGEADEGFANEEDS